MQLQSILQPLGSLDYVWDNPAEPVPEGTFCHLFDFLEQNEDNTGRHTNNLDELPPIQTNWCPTSTIPTIFLRRMPFLTQPSQFILACIPSGLNANECH